MKKLLSRAVVIVLIIFFDLSYAFPSTAFANPDKLKAIEARINSVTINPDFKDDIYGLIVIKQALTSLKNRSGGIRGLFTTLLEKICC